MGNDDFESSDRGVLSEEKRDCLHRSVKGTEGKEESINSVAFGSSADSSK